MDLMHIIMHIAVTQLFLILILLFFFHFTSRYLHYKKRQRQQRMQRMESILTANLHESVTIDHRNIHFFDRYIFDFVEVFRHAIKHYHRHPHWPALHAQVSDLILKPQAKVLAKSRDWFKRYLATQCLEYASGEFDEQVLLQLVQDNIMFVAVNTAMLICEQPIPITVNKLILEFSDKKHVIQSTLIHMLVIESVKRFKQVDTLVDIVNTRLALDTNTSIRIFCYRMLNALTYKASVPPFVLTDVHSDNYELKIEALTLLTKLDPKQAMPFLKKTLSDQHEEVRATAVTLLASTKDEAVIPHLTGKLRDRAWWVRVNAGNALLSFGKHGIKVLKEVTEINDKYASETARAMLTMLAHRKHHDVI